MPITNGFLWNVRQKNVLFLKTHKTGSSTITNIFFRYGDLRNLFFCPPTNYTARMAKKISGYVSTSFTKQLAKYFVQSRTI